MGNEKKNRGNVGDIVNKVIHLTDTVYGTPVSIFIGDREAYAKYCYKEFRVKDIPRCGYSGEYNMFENNNVVPFHFVAVIWMARFNFSIQSYEILAHEIIHCAWGILDVSNVKVTAKNHEALAYLFSGLYKQAMEKLLKLKIRKK